MQEQKRVLRFGTSSKKRTEDTEREYLLIFDQFEEFFTYPINQQIAFRKQIAELLHLKIPKPLRETWRSLSPELRAHLSKGLRITVLFAIREDKLSFMNSLRIELPTIFQHRYELKGLSRSQARKAIVNPAALPQGNIYASPAFQYEEEALEIIIEKLGESYQQQHFENPTGTAH